MPLVSRLILTTFLLFLASCATRHVVDPELNLMNESDVTSTLENWTARTQKYEGLYNTIDATATLRNTPVIKALLHQSARMYRWDKAKLDAESNKAFEKARNETEIFLSFYTPDRKNDDLHKMGTQWRVYLDAGGRRWEGKVTKNRLALTEIQSLYPYHTRFATAYSVTFPVPTSQIEVQTSRLTVTGPVGMANIDFGSASPHF